MISINRRGECRVRWITLAALVLAKLWLPAPSVASPHAQAQSFAEFLAVQDIVVLGTVESSKGEARPLSAMPHTEVKVKTSELLVGSLTDSTLLVAMTSPGSGSGPIPGSRVLVWAHRESEDAWRIWGNLCVVRADGRLLIHYGEEEGPHYLGPFDTTYLSLPALRAALVTHSRLYSSTAFEGKAALALGRVVRTTRRRDGFTFECDSLGWIMGSAPSVPRFIDWLPIPSCHPDLFPGDTLLIPIAHAAYNGNRVALTACPRGLCAKRGFVPALGVPLDSIDLAIRRDASGLHAKPLVSRAEN